MFAPRFNSRPVMNKTKRRPTSVFTSNASDGRPVYNDFDALDAGFEDIAAGQEDVQIAPGVVAHFGHFVGGNANRNYHAVPLLERITK